jgi:GDPmannose 4,6-dehydratase
MWRMLQQTAPDDFILATGESHSVREFIEIALQCRGKTIRWEGEGVDEIGKDETGRTIVRVNPEFYRPAEVDTLIGDASKALAVLGWKSTTTFPQLVARMVAEDTR